MAGYSAPVSTHDPSTGAVIPTAWGDAVNAAIDYLATNKAHCRVYNSANISITTSGTPQALTFNSERYDVGACHSTSSNTSRLTAPTGEGGKYDIKGHTAWAANGTGVARQSRIRVNGSTYIAMQNSNPPSASTGGEGSIATDYALAAGDYVELVVVQDSGGALNCTASANYSPEFSMKWWAT